MEKSSNPSVAPRSVIRVVNILRSVAQAPNGLSLSALSQELDGPKSSILSLIRGLVDGGYIVNDGGSFVLGEESFRLAELILHGNSFSDVVRSVLFKLASKTGETAVLGVLSPDDRVVFIERVLSTKTLAAHVQIGESRALYASASGRAILAMLPPERIAKYLKRTDLKPRTEYTEVRPAKLDAILQDIRKRGYAVTDGESDIGLAGVAAPILDRAGLPIGSIVVSGPTERLRPKIQEWSVLVKEAANSLSGLSSYFSNNYSTI